MSTPPPIVGQPAPTTLQRYHCPTCLAHSMTARTIDAIKEHYLAHREWGAIEAARLDALALKSF